MSHDIKLEDYFEGKPMALLHARHFIEAASDGEQLQSSHIASALSHFSRHAPSLSSDYKDIAEASDGLQKFYVDFTKRDMDM